MKARKLTEQEQKQRPTMNHCLEFNDGSRQFFTEKAMVELHGELSEVLASTPTRQVSDEEIEKAFPIKEPEKNDPLTVYNTKLNNRHKCYRMGAKWMRDQDPITTSLPSKAEIDNWLISEAPYNLTAVHIYEWLKSRSNTREGDEPPKN